MREAQPVLELDNPSPEAFAERCVRARVPALIRGSVMPGQLACDWTPEAVVRALGDRSFAFKSSTSNAHPDFRSRTIAEMFARRSLTFTEFFEAILSGPEDARSRLIFTGDEHYVGRVRNGRLSVNSELSKLWPQGALPPWVPPERLYSVWAWFSGQGVRTWLHYDNNGCHNLNMQVHGRKLCTLFSPDLLEGLDFFPIGGNNPALNCSRLDVETAEVDAYIQTLERYETELEAGDCLFIPAHYIHTVRHLGEYNANLNFWWKPELTEQDPSASENPVVRREAEIRRLSAELAAP